MVIVGGLVAAAASASPFAHDAWLAAYLVLVGGVSQIALGVGQRFLRVAPVPTETARLEFVLWNAGNIVVVAGVLLDVPAIVLVGSGALCVALGLFAHSVRGVSPRCGVPAALYRVVLVGLAISVPVGCVLAFAGGS